MSRSVTSFVSFVFVFGFVLVAGAVWSPAAARPLSEIIARTGLSPEDFEIMAAAARSLYAGGAARAGAEAVWSNPATGARGTVRLEQVEGRCVALLHRIELPGRDGPGILRVRRCRAADGAWLLQP